MSNGTAFTIAAVIIGAIVVLGVCTGGDDGGSSGGASSVATKSECIRYLGNQDLSAASRNNCRQVLGSEYCSYVGGAIGYRIEEGKDVDKLRNLRSLHC